MENTNTYQVPIVLMFFKRFDYIIQIIDRIREIKPQKIYLFSDGGRTEEENNIIHFGRQKIEQAIDWECEVIKRYQFHNIGVYEQIALGAKWVFEREEYAIFLEDDNLPELSFFPFCEQMLKLYKNNDKILWICGTNYLGDYKSDNDYFFTKNMLPCGWASWSEKFLKYYDFNLESINQDKFKQKFLKKYKNKKLGLQRYESIIREKKHFENNSKYISWDYHMVLTIRMHDLYGIVPSKNQIKNIGVDEHSIHGGKSFKNIMTKRFCGMDSYKLNMPIKVNEYIQIDRKFERKLNNVILLPLRYRIKGKLSKIYHFIKGDRK